MKGRKDGKKERRKEGRNIRGRNKIRGQANDEKGKEMNEVK